MKTGLYFVITLLIGASFVLFKKVNEIAATNDSLSKEVVLLKQEMNQMVVHARQLLQYEIDDVAKQGRLSVKDEIELQASKFMSLIENRLETSVIKSMKLERLTIVDSNGADRIIMGTGNSEFNGVRNTFIKLTSPSSLNPVILSTTDKSASVSVSKRSFLSANKSAGSLILYNQQYKKGSKANIILLTNEKNSKMKINHDYSGPSILANSSSDASFYSVLKETNNLSYIAGVSEAGYGAAELYGKDGKVIYAVQETSDGYVNTYVKANPKKKIWNAVSTLSTINSLWKIISK